MSDTADAPLSSSSLQPRLQACLDRGSKADRALASYMLAKLSSVPFETAASLAAKVGVSEATVGRFCRALGYASFKDLKGRLRQDIGDRPWLISDRLRAFRERSLAGEDQLARGLELEIAALVAVYEQARGEAWARAARRLATASRVYVAGFQTERGMAQLLAHQLQYLRDEVVLLDSAGGNFAELLLAATPSPCLVLFEARRYSRLARLLARDAHQAGIPVTLVTDAFCDWGRGLADELFVVPTELGLFWDSNAPMASLVNRLVNAVFIELGPAVEDRLGRVASLYSRFVGHVGDPSGPVR